MEEMNKKRKSIMEFIKKNIPNKNSKIIEIGCHKGINTEGLISSGYNNVLATDIIKYGKISHFMKMDAWEIDYSSYDVIIACGLFEYIVNLKGFLTKLHTEMKKGAKIIFAVPNVCSLSKRVKCLMGVNPNREGHQTLSFTIKTMNNLLGSFPQFEYSIFGSGNIYIKNYCFNVPKSMSGNIIGVISKW